MEGCGWESALDSQTVVSSFVGAVGLCVVWVAGAPVHVELDLCACQSACLLVAIVVMCFLFSVLCCLSYFFLMSRGAGGSVL